MVAYPPDWRVFLVTEDNLAAILRHGGYRDDAELLANINAHIASQHLKDIGCEAFSKSVASIEEFYPGDELRDGIYTKYYFAISPKAGVIGFIATEQTFEGEDEDELDIYHTNLFTHESNTGRECYVAKISWTCSFTNSPVIFRGRKVKDVIGANKPAYAINMGKYITDNVCEMMLNDLHRYDSDTSEIQQVMLVSTGIDSARVRHRKNGKLTACKFLEEWVNYHGSNIMEEYGLDHKGSLMFYLYDRNLTTFIGSDDYEFLKKTGSDLATIIDDTLTNNSRFANTNYTCPSGMTFDRRTGFVEEGREGREYEFRPLNTEKRNRNNTNNNDIESSAAKRTRKYGGRSRTTRTRGRRSACRRPSRRRGNN